MKTTTHYPPSILLLYFLGSYITILILCVSYLTKISLADPLTIIFTVTMTLSYGVFYLIPAMIITGCSHWFLQRIQKQKKSITLLFTEYAIAILTTSATLILLFADRVVFRLFNFHLNGFVWNLVTTPGGIESMGGSDSASLTYGMICFGIVCLHIGILATCYWLCQHERIVCMFSGRFKTVAIIIVIIMGTAQALIYGVSSFKNNLSVINTAIALPLYQPLTMKGLAKKLGIKPPPKSKNAHLKAGEGSLDYPLESLVIKKKDTPLNIVWLIAESWRADMLTPEIMPNMSSFATQANNFHQHYSGGNGTRMGLFSQFYGLYGTYWFQFLNERQSPVVMDVLQQQKYQLSLYTSAKFTYPEFDKTLFASIPPEKLHEVKGGTNWQKDRTNVSNMLSFIKKRDPSRPFMTFMFFESPHARYYFPEEDAIRTPYLEDFNYATMSLEKDMGLIFNRYVNACHHLDSQLGRVTAFLKEEHLLDNTIVIMTGDHGEEFLENGHWGHNSEFTEQQVRVPLLLWVPGVEHREIKRMTSHLDLPATILPLLGVENPASTYSLGYNLLGKEKRSFTIICDWSRIAYVDHEYKAIFPFSTKSLDKSYLTTKDDKPLADSEQFWKSRQKTMVEILHNLKIFLTP